MAAAASGCLPGDPSQHSSFVALLPRVAELPELRPEPLVLEEAGDDRRFGGAEDDVELAAYLVEGVARQSAPAEEIAPSGAVEPFNERLVLGLSPGFNAALPAAGEP